MKLELIEYIEEFDGGASVTIDLDEEAKMYLIERGFNNMLMDAIENLKYEKSSEDTKNES